MFLGDVLERFGQDDVRVVYKNTPLSFHKQAHGAAYAALAAHAQGRFWEMHDELYNHQDRLAPRDLETWAAAVGLDMGRFRADMAAGRWKAAVAADLEQAARLGVRGTPNIFINGRLLRGARALDEVEDVLLEEITTGEALRRGGVTDVHHHLTRNGKEFTPLGEEVHVFNVQDAPGKGGVPGAPIEIVVFSDFQCPYSSKVTPALDAVVEHYRGQARLIFKQFPLAFHEQARAAATASLAAHAQGKFWEMHDRLFANHRNLGRAALEGHARDLGLDMDAFTATLDKGLDGPINADMAEGKGAGVRGTPTFFVNGRKYQAPGRSADDIIKVIDKHVLSR